MKRDKSEPGDDHERPNGTRWIGPMAPGWILAIIACVTFFGSAGIWAVKTWFSIQSSATYVTSDILKTAEVDLKLMGQAQRLAILNERTCVLFRLERLKAESGGLAVVMVPIECGNAAYNTPP